MNIIRYRAGIKEAGIRDGYPKCCIRHFIRLLFKGVLPALYMSLIYRINHDLDFVLCHECYQSVIHHMEMEEKVGNKIVFPTFQNEIK